jgi:mannose-6-phosphate isomerase-like protein (cupin superfamily)
MPCCVRRVCLCGVCTPHDRAKRMSSCTGLCSSRRVAVFWGGASLIVGVLALASFAAASDWFLAHASRGCARLQPAAWQALTPQAFDAQYQKTGTPVVLVGAGGAHGGWDPALWTVSALKSRFQSTLFRFGDAPYPAVERPLASYDEELDGVFQYGNVPVTYSLLGPGHACRPVHSPPYAFAAPIHANATVACMLVADTRLPSPLRGATIRLAGLMMGRAQQATKSHRHDSAVNVLLHGQKSWVIRGCTCMQYAGDAVFIPNQADHQVVNVRASVAVQLQWHEGHFLTNVGHDELQRYLDAHK